MMLATLFALTLCVPQAAAQNPPRDARLAGAPPATASISGRVTDAETGAPIARLPVRLAGNRGMERATLTDEDGRYGFQDLQPGDYAILADPSSARPMYQHGTYREKSASFPGRMKLAAGEARTKIDIQLKRAFALDVRVVDDAGDPIADMEVMLESVRGSFGGGRQRTTDDRGYVRLFGLMPGTYRVCAVPRPSQIAPAASGEALVRTCYPSAVRDVDAAPVTLTPRGLPELEIRLQRAGVHFVSGAVVDASGVPVENARISLVRFRRLGTSSDDGNVERTPNGGFTVRGLPPGDYAINATAPGDDPRNPYEGRDLSDSAHVPFSITTGPVEGLSVVLRPRATVSGRIVIEPGPEPPTAEKLIIQASMPRGVMTYRPPAKVNKDLTFTIDGLLGEVSFYVGELPPDWFVRSITYGDEDIQWKPTDFSVGPRRRLEITLSGRGATVHANVLDDAAAPVAGRPVVAVLLPTEADPKSFPRRVRMAYPREGGFTFRGVPPGEYFALAIPAEELPGMEGEEYQALTKLAQRVTIHEAEQRTIEVRVTRGVDR